MLTVMVFESWKQIRTQIAFKCSFYWRIMWPYSLYSRKKRENETDKVDRASDKTIQLNRALSMEIKELTCIYMCGVM